MTATSIPPHDTRLPAAGGPVAVPSTGPHSPALRMAATVARAWRRVLAVAAATTVAGVVAALLMPRAYVAGTLLVPFTGSSSRSSVAASALPAGLSGLIGAVGAGSPAERILGPVLTSGTLYGLVLERATAGGAAPREVVANVLRKGVRVVRNTDGSIVVQVRAPDPTLAARIANLYPGAINDVLSRVSAEGTQTKQRFLRAQLDSADARLGESERKLVEFAQRRDAPAAEQQAQRTLDAAAALQQSILEQELAVGQLRRTATPSNPELRAAEALLASRRAQLQRLTSGGVGNRSVFVPIERGPELRVASTRVEREYQQDERVYASLAAAVTDAQIDVSNSLPVLTVLDAAAPPADPTLTVGMAATLSLGFGLVLGVLVAFLTDLVARLRADPATAAVWAASNRSIPGASTNGR